MSDPVGAEKGQKPVRNIRSDELIGLLSSRVVGQAHALEHIVPSIQLHLSGLAPEGRPVGVFLLLGPTGTGKNPDGRGACRSPPRRCAQRDQDRLW